LQHEARFAKVFWVVALPDFVCGEAVAVCGEGFDDGGQGVWCFEPGFSVEVCFYAGDLGVEGFGDEEVGAVPEVFDESLGWLVRD
jgi:hypothetical protein